MPLKKEAEALAEAEDGRRVELSEPAEALVVQQALELDVVAEGIENEAQRRIATEEGCVYLQGYLFAEPAGMDALLEMASA